jgi:hypothetical protein
MKHNPIRFFRKPSALGVLLCYNDGDILEDVIMHLLSNHHRIIVWDHGSDDETSAVLDKFNDSFIERKFLPRSFDFYKLYPKMSQNLIDNYIDKFDWISWPDQDEILEGPTRKKDYYSYITDVYRSRYNWIQFNNFNYWFTEKDDQKIKSPVQRIKYYSLFPNCAPRIRSWRASATNIREFNHNPPKGKRYPIFFNLRHYSMRSEQQMKRRLNKDRADIRRGSSNIHYQNMQKRQEDLLISSDRLHHDHGGELDHESKFNWEKIYF